jgi:hypothetical protein
MKVNLDCRGANGLQVRLANFRESEQLLRRPGSSVDTLGRDRC